MGCLGVNQIFSRFFGFIKDFFQGSSGCRIASINLEKQEVVFHVQQKSIFLTCSFDEAIGDLSILESLGSTQACWLGGCYGRALKRSFTNKEAFRTTKSQSFLLRNTKRGCYQIAFQARNGDIGYFNKSSRREFTDSPVSLAKNDYIISKFSPSQACYIGILAGIFIEKNAFGLISGGRPAAPRPALRVVK